MLIQIRRALHIKHENAQENCIRIRQSGPIRAGFSLCDKISRSPNFLSLNPCGLSNELFVLINFSKIAERS